MTAEQLEQLLATWRERARMYSRNLDQERDPRGIALLRGKFFAYLNCANELTEAMGCDTQPEPCGYVPPDPVGEIRHG